MELEILKSEWAAMNSRMEKQEIIKEKMFCEMLNVRSDRSLGRLMAYDVISLIAAVVFIPVLILSQKRCGNSSYGFHRQLCDLHRLYTLVCDEGLGIAED